MKTKLPIFFLSEKCPWATDKGYSISHYTNLDITWCIQAFNTILYVTCFMFILYRNLEFLPTSVALKNGWRTEREDSFQK